MLHYWRHVALLHWPVPEQAVQARLPAGLTVQTFDDVAWIVIVTLLMDGVRAPGLPALPWLSRFPEINLRTYVRGADGRSGIWFFSLDAARLPVVAAARASYGLPYQWAAMSLRRGPDGVSYHSRRRGPVRRGTRCDVRVRAGAVIPDRQVSTLEHFLTARFRLYSRLAGRLVAADAEHGPWPLRRAEPTGLRTDLVEAAGLPATRDPPLVHASDGVTGVRIGAWRPLRPAGAARSGTRPAR